MMDTWNWKKKRASKRIKIYEELYVNMDSLKITTMS